MKIEVRSPRWDRALDVDNDTDTTVLELKGTIRSRLDDCTTFHLIHGGSILVDGVRLSDLAIDDAPTLWLLPTYQPPHACAQLPSVSSIGMFDLTCLPPNEQQGNIVPACATLLQTFSESLGDGSLLWRASASEHDAMIMAIKALSSAEPAFGNAPHITWFGEYGCALIASVPRVGEVHLRVVGLDGWQFRMHSSGFRFSGMPMHGTVQAGGRTHTADASPSVSVVDHVGHVPLDNYVDFMGKVHHLLTLAAARKGEKRSAAANDQGNQKTPAMIKAVLIDALSGRDDGETSPRGGFTDVGLHTGGVKRNTAWALIRAVLQALLEDGEQGLFFRHAMAQLKLWIAEVLASSCPGEGSSLEDHTVGINSCMQVLAAAVEEGASLSDEQTHIRGGSDRKLDMEAFEARCVLVRHQLEQKAEQCAEAVAANFKLPLQDKSELQCSNMVLSPPEEMPPAKLPDGINAARTKAAANLSWLPTAPTDCIMDSLSSWLLHNRLAAGKGSVAALYLLETVERTFFAKVEELMDAERREYETGEIASRKWVEQIELIVDQYRRVMASFCASSDFSATLTVERKSRELLVVWCAFCLVHKATLPFEFQVLSSYSVALRPDDLRHLVLSGRLAIEAAQHVAAYLREHTKSGRDVFSLRPTDVTFQMAAEHAGRNEETMSLWQSERDGAATRQAAHWNVVQEKQAKLRVLDREAARLEAEWGLAIAKRDRYERPWRHSSRQNDQDWNDYNNAASMYESQLDSTRAQIRATEQPPPAIFQPLPRNIESAKPIMFFLTMPVHFQVLSRMSFTAQQMLLPRSAEIVSPTTDDKINISDAIAVLDPKTHWRTYYLSASTARHLPSASVIESKVVLQSNHVVPQSSHFSPSNVRAFSSPEIGVWYPDDIAPRLTWTGGSFDLDARGGAYFNPFAPLSDAALVCSFTEPLTQGQRSMQWALVQQGDKSESCRGNVPEARQDIKPSWLAGKTELFSFGALRAYPNQQVRKLCVALRERSMPLSEGAVRKLLQSALYHLGELSGGASPRPKWRTDLVTCGGWEALRLELESLADELKQKPREHGAVLILGEIAAHASQWDEESRPVARRFAQIALEWARGDIESAPPSKVPQLRARRCIFSMYAIVCHGAGELSSEDMTSLCEGVLLADYSRLFEDPTPLDKAVRELTVVTYEVLARRLPELLAKLDEDSSPLTAAVACVLPALTPPALTWTRVVCDNQRTACFEAVTSGSEPHLFSVNLQTGVVLYDGLPPSRLPQTILNLPLYKRTFSDKNFEVVLTSSGVLETVRLQRGFKYEFHVDACGRLVAREIDPEHYNRPLELLDGTPEGVKQWGRQLPSRLEHMCSHWYCRSGDTIVLRNRRHDERLSHFILKRSCQQDGVELPNFAGDTGWLCFRVPSHHAQQKWQSSCALVSTFDQMVLPTSKVLDVLTKFEPDAGIVHAFYTAGDGALVLELPRFDLGFRLVEEGPLQGKLVSNNFLGFSLSQDQQLPHAMGGFSQYLLLESSSQRLLITPVGEVKRGGDKICVSISSACDADVRLHVYELHPRFLNVEAKAGATAIEARLQLAALYAATGTELPEVGSRLTGGEAAIELLRQSWKGGPMSREEHRQLLSLASFNQLTPALPLVCFEVDTCARELLCLWPDSEKTPELLYDADAGTEYTQRKQRRQLSVRALLTPCEEARVLAAKVSSRPSSTMPLVGSLDVPASASYAREIDDIETELRSMLSEKAPVQAKAFPLLESDVKDNAISKSMLADLGDSWSAHQRMCSVQLAKPIKTLKEDLHAQHAVALRYRQKIERHLLLCVDQIPAIAGWHASAFVMRRAANFEPRVTLRDLARAAWEPEGLRQFNPFLSEAAVREVLRPAILEWLKLCVLEDKLERMEFIAADGNAQELERELKEVGREWSVKEHPQWLVFEVEQRLQIRHVQYKVAKFCISQKGSITQLNMGEGKTRVILPMLLLHLAQGDKLVRLHFLSQLIDEAYYYLHRHLTASLMCRRLLRLPFHRDVKLTPLDVAKMHDSLSRCMRMRGALCVAPEHRLSLQLKWHEMRLSEKDELVELLPRLDKLPYCDVLDESDEILHHKYQLIYAWGHNVLLPSGKERWRAVQTVLKVLETSPEVAGLLQTPDVARRFPGDIAGSFDDLRLLAGSALDSVRTELNSALMAALMEDPPYHMRWLSLGHPLAAMITKFVTDSTASLAWLHEQDALGSINELQCDQLLALRGLLAMGMLEHCLTRRHRVDYGVDGRRGLSRRVAVPYRASDTPALRAEYAQPDTLITLTHLSYYHTGLKRGEIKEAVAVLLTLGPMRQKAEYNTWLESAKPTMNEEQLSALDHVNKIDITSDVQLDHLCAVYQYNMAAINFWLDACVLPRETMQFPTRLVANAFNLTDNPGGDVVGFSGTKDNHLLLPLHVTQRTPDGATELLATDGKMCDLVLGNEEVVPLDAMDRLSEAVLSVATQRGASALIDAGATMAGLSNEAVATRAIELLTAGSRLKGAVYFDSDKASWYVRNREGRSWPQSSSPIHERDCFVYFDESRCRGADMKLLPDAMAVLTIGPDMCKEKLMQAAGRMRKLDRGQRLLFTVPPELVPKIRDAVDASNSMDVDGSQPSEAQHSMQCVHQALGSWSQPMSSHDLLKWLMRNTANATAAGIPEYASQASHFCMTQDPRARLIDESLSLAELYGSAIGEEKVDAVVKRTIKRDQARCAKLGFEYTATATELSNKVLERAREYGFDLRIISTGVEEECERELENERELERERELQKPKQAPLTPVAWPFSRVPGAQNPMELAEAGVMSLGEAINACLRPPQVELSSIPWDLCKIFVTKAFIETVADGHGARLDDLSDFMRPLDAIVVFQTSEVLLLSEWEADAVLAVMWNVRFHRTFLANLSYLVEAADEDRPSEEIKLRVPPHPASHAKAAEVQDITIAGLQLLAGQTMFSTSARKESIQRLAAPSPAAKRAALKIVELRGRQHMISRSDLEVICNADIGEA